MANDIAQENDSVRLWAEKHLHVLWGLSKDACLSGLRLGLVHTRNAELRTAIVQANHFSTASSFAQHAAATVLLDVKTCSDFFERCAMDLKEAAFTVVYRLHGETSVRCVLPEAGLFVWCDLRSIALPGESEAKLFQAINQEAKLVLTPGTLTIYHINNPQALLASRGFPSSRASATRRFRDKSSKVL